MSLSDPTDFEGTSIGIPTDGTGDRNDSRKAPTSNAATGASAAGVRALSAQVVAFYFRAPIKAFFRTRVDYLAYAKAINPQAQAGWSLRSTTPGLLAHAVQKYGWSFIPQHVLPPLFANVTVGAILYTSYLQILGVLHPPSSSSTKRVFPPPPPSATFTAGMAAGGIQSLVAAPLDALQVRFDRSDALEGKYKSMWSYGKHKLQEIGPRGIFAGWSLSFLKDSIGCAVFFSTFEYVKAQAYYRFIATYYTTSGPMLRNDQVQVQRVKPHYAIEPMFLLAAGMSASVAQQLVQYPLSTLQTLHYERLETIDHAARTAASRRDIFRTYYHAYKATLHEATNEANNVAKNVSRMSLARWLYRGFWWNTIRQVPSTSAALVIFELVRRKYGTEPGEQIRLRHKDREVVVY